MRIENVITPKISVITATYNSEKYLKKSINSVKAQSYKNIEYIIVDGGSKDGTVDIIRSNEGIVSKWISEPDNGIYDAWNKGLAMATGELIAFIGADDYYYPDAIQDFADFISSNETEDVLYVSSKVHIVSEEGKILREFGWPWNWETFRRFNIIAHPGSLQSRKLFEQYGLYDTRYKIAADYELLLRPKQRLNALFMNKVTAQVTQGGVSYQTKMFKELKAIVESTGATSKWQATVDYILNVVKLSGKKFACRLGLNVYLKTKYEP